MKTRYPLPTLLAVFLLAWPLAGCGAEAGLPDRPEAEILETYGEGDDADQLVLDQLAKAGSDLGKPTDVRWYVYFPANRSAEAFAALVREAGWQIERRPARADARSLCLCSRDTVPTLEAIRAMRAELEELARGLDPDIDGWEAAVQK